MAPDGKFCLHSSHEKQRSGAWLQKTVCFGSHPLHEKHRSGTWLQKASLPSTPSRKSRDLGHSCRRRVFLTLPKGRAKIWGIAPEGLFSLHSLQEKHRSATCSRFKPSSPYSPFRKSIDLGYGSIKLVSLTFPQEKA